MFLQRNTFSAMMGLALIVASGCGSRDRKIQQTQATSGGITAVNYQASSSSGGKSLTVKWNAPVSVRSFEIMACAQGGQCATYMYLDCTTGACRGSSASGAPRYDISISQTYIDANTQAYTVEDLRYGTLGNGYSAVVVPK